MNKLLPFVVTYYGYCHSLDGTTLFSKVDSNKLRINVKNKMTLIDAKFDSDLKTKWIRFFWPALYMPLGCVKCYVNRCNESLMTTDDNADFWPVSKFNIDSACSCS